MKANQLGQEAENYACRYLEQKGLKLISRNFRCRMGEIDLIMQDNDCLVFIEVRYRNSYAFGGPLASITHTKQQRLLATARTYLQKFPPSKSLSTRIDVVGLSTATEKPQIEWIKNAIEACG